MECGEAQKIIKMNSLMNILANGLIINQMGSVNILGVTMEMSMKENGNIVSDMGRELILFLLVIFTLESIVLVKLMAMVNIIGLMVINILVSFIMEWNMVKVHGKKLEMKTLINMKENIRMIKSTDMENSLGKLAVNLKDST